MGYLAAEMPTRERVARVALHPHQTVALDVGQYAAGVRAVVGTDGENDFGLWRMDLWGTHGRLLTIFLEIWA